MPSHKLPKRSDKITPHFEYHEVIDSQIAINHDLDNNIYDATVMAVALHTCQQMELIRSLFKGYYVSISSFFRCPRLNILAGGSKRSQHPKAEAVDFTIPGKKLIEVFLIIIKSGIKFDQLIFEYGRWIHISFCMDATKNRGEILTCHKTVDGEKKYELYTNVKQLERMVA